MTNRCSDYISHYRLDAEHFDYFANEDRTDRAYETLFRKFIARLAGRHKQVLDIGSGDGWVAALPHTLLHHVDLSMKNLKNLASPSAAPTLADAARLPYKDKSMDLIVASEILEHLNSPQLAASEILRVLSDDGVAIVSTPYKERLRYTLCIHCNQPTPLNAHLTSFDRESLSALFPGCSIRVHLFGSKVLTHLRAAKLFEKLPLWIWMLANYPLLKLIDKAQHIVLVIRKSNYS